MLLNKPELRLQTNQALHYLERFLSGLTVEGGAREAVYNWVDFGGTCFDHLGLVVGSSPPPGCTCT
jgi:hypothetical protein